MRRDISVEKILHKRYLGGKKLSIDNATRSNKNKITSMPCQKLIITTKRGLGEYNGVYPEI